MNIPEQDRADARERLTKVAEIYWGVQSGASMNYRNGVNPYKTWELIVERVFRDYARVGKVKIDVIKQRAQQSLREKYASKN